MTALERGDAAAEAARLRAALQNVQGWALEGLDPEDGIEDGWAEVVRLRAALGAAEGWALEGLHPNERCTGTSFWA